MQQLHGPITRTKVRGGLAKWQLDRVIDHIESRLADSIKVDELAQLAGLSASQFTRAFRRSTGVPPHRWHLSARIRRAQQLIRDTQQPLAEIAISTASLTRAISPTRSRGGWGSALASGGGSSGSRR